ncbi:MAG: 7-cyano-7-deazaguanine synthase QueC [Thermodesulfovibrionales bacterium]
MQPVPPKAVILLSGGVDSSTAMAMAKAEGYELYALSFDYRQRHDRELEAAAAVAAALGAAKHLVVRFDLSEIGGSALTGSGEVPKNRRGLETGEAGLPAIPATYVPARNTIFLSFALGWAEVLGAEDIFIGANAVDYSGYPDCRPEYLASFETMANLATKAAVEKKMTFTVRAPLLRMTKAEIIRQGNALGLDYGLTWSCYDPQHVRDAPGVARSGTVVPCRTCDSCRFRQKGFEEAGVPDPLLR